jgi:NAD(P)H dehydrogenase (quinone)
MASPPPVDQMIVLAHPSPDSFCMSVARRWQARARKHHQACELRDLYGEGFDPILKDTEQPGKAAFAPLAEIEAERHRIEQLGVLVFVYPVWFGTPPAMLKGYLERVVGSGVSFAPGAPKSRPLAAVRLVQIATSASSEPWLAEKGVRGALHTLYDQYIAEMFGAKHAYRLHLDSVSQDMGDLHAGFLLAKVDALADQVSADANADRWERARHCDDLGPGPKPE